MAAMLVAAERPGEPMTAILPCAAETGTGVPRAAACRWFDGLPGSDVLLGDCLVNTVEIPLRSDDGVPRPEDEVNDVYASAVAGTHGRPVVYVTHGTKTGLIAPTALPSHADVIVDARQARIEPDDVGRYLRRGWPVVVTGSKFFGGPAFSGAVLFPRGRGWRRSGASPCPLASIRAARWRTGRSKRAACSAPCCAGQLLSM